ncbi:MAG: porin family protein [Cyclobacteriaceae bacterium]|jgi:hypothetical protein
MKKIIILVIPLLIVQIVSSAQVDLGLLAGIDNGRLYGDKFSQTQYKPNTGFLFGLSIDPQINDLISLSIQPGYITTGSSIQVPDSTANDWKDSVTISVDYLFLDVFVKIQSKSKRLYFSSGLEFGYGLSLIAENELQEVDITDELNKWNMSLIFGIGYKIPIKRSGLYFELRYSQGLVNMTKADPEVDDDIPRVKLSGLKIVTGFQIPISKRN